MSQTSNITVIIITLNEEINLPHSLSSCQFADEIFVVDSGSTDGTEEISLQYGANFIFHQWEGFSKQRNWALRNVGISTDWVLILDADERVSNKLMEEIQFVASFRHTSSYNAYYVNRYFIWEGKKIKHCGYFPSWNVRFFRNGKAYYEEREVHEHMIVEGPSGYLKGELIHEDRRGRDYIWKKHLEYAGLEAREIYKTQRGIAEENRISHNFLGGPIERRRAIKERIWPYLPFRWVFRFLYMYFLKLGLLDGTAGLDLCIFMTKYEREIGIKLKDLKRIE